MLNLGQLRLCHDLLHAIGPVRFQQMNKIRFTRVSRGLHQEWRDAR